MVTTPTTLFMITYSILANMSVITVYPDVKQAEILSEKFTMKEKNPVSDAVV